LPSRRTPSRRRRTRPEATRTLLGHVGARVDLARIDELLERAEIDHGEFLAVRLVEAALRQALVERHLAALEGVDRDARAGLLALDAAAAGLADARARAAADPLARLGGAGIVAEFVQFHDASPLAGYGGRSVHEPADHGMCPDFRL
jgi:hypothetical protein